MNIIYHTNITQFAQDHYDRVCTKLKKAKGDQKFYDSSVHNKLRVYINDHPGEDQINLFEYFKTHHHEIITGKPDRLEFHRKKIQKIIKKDKIKFTEKKTVKGKLVDQYTPVYNAIVNCFDYGTFTGTIKAYDLLKPLDVDVCPYCNRQFVNTYIDDDGRTRATLDHFYSRSDHPYFALSFFNLVPSCYVCNSSFKGRKEFSADKNSNPYVESFENIVAFTIGYDKKKGNKEYKAEFYQNEDNFKIQFKKLVDDDDDELTKVINNIKTFKLDKMYNLHKGIIVKLVEQDIIFKKGGLAKDIHKMFPRIFAGPTDVLSALTGYIPDEKKFNKQTFSRLVRDISVEMKLHKGIT